jgi:hypothetical protein
MITKEHFTSIGYDTNGNGRWVIFHPHFILDDENIPVHDRYITALSRAALLGGKKHHTKTYVGGIVFQGDPTSLAVRINAFMERREWEITKVIFRKYPNGDIIALFPEIVGDCDWRNNCQSYMHVGQHGSASYSGVMQSTSPASFPEAQDLREELTRIGYNLKTMKRQAKEDVEMRRKEVEG